MIYRDINDVASKIEAKRQFTDFPIRRACVMTDGGNEFTDSFIKLWNACEKAGYEVVNSNAHPPSLASVSATYPRWNVSADIVKNYMAYTPNGVHIQFDVYDAEKCFMHYDMEYNVFIVPHNKFHYVMGKYISAIESGLVSGFKRDCVRLHTFSKYIYYGGFDKENDELDELFEKFKDQMPTC